MITKRGMALLLFVFLFAASLGWSQSTSGTGNTGNGAGASSSSGSTATIYNNEGSAKSQFIGAIPGAATSFVPGYAADNGPCRVYWPAAERRMTMNEIRSWAKRGKAQHMDWDGGDPNTIPTNDDDVEVVNYDPEAIAWKGDRVIGAVEVEGEYHHIAQGTLARAELEAKEKWHTRRIAIRDCPESSMHTKAHDVGLGGAFSEVPGGGNAANAASLGVSFGSSRTTNEKRDVFTVLALNDWPEDAPDSCRGQFAPNTCPAKAEEPKNSPAPAAAAPPAQPPPAPPAESEHQAPPTPPVTTPAPVAATAPATADPCDVPQLTIYFVLAKYDVGGEYTNGIKNFASWMRNHPTCKMQVQGHASKEASGDFNAKLGRHRSEAVYNLLIADGAPKDQLEYASLGKDFPKSDYEKENRRVILVVQGPASGK